MSPTRRLRFADLSILYKILSGFSLCCFLAAALGAFAVWRLNDGKNLMLDFSNSSLPSIQSLRIV
ncbi:hypothetical protein [Xanthomonas theicola]|uniref:Uncharacterized protein n=1 Tax=Xanthomonas theicola TaxID=56464 RepID=A0A2S6ZBB5_9XANT|nr:hypothetical protein [Xanthomonas theicola]PPT82524.1 hypothetical protein XthCFBP4691_17365 [Xanthomonas theicola]QNH25281.1 hypothetical protein G4Q83_11755 [Xanthomonas theicola]